MHLSIYSYITQLGDRGMTKIGSYLFVASCLLTTTLVTAQDQDSYSTDENNTSEMSYPEVGYPETSIYSAYKINKPNDYAGLANWVSSNFSSDASRSVYYLPQTINDITLDDKSLGISFETWEHDHYVKNTLVEKGKTLYLYTIVDPNFDPNKYADTDLDDATTVNSGSFSFEKNSGNYTKQAASCDSKNKCNCVLWVRNCRASWLPTGMTYIWEKKSKMNTDKADKGRVAVMDIYYPYGHVGYITKVNGSKITIEEANYKTCAISSRTDKASNMKIAGYIKKK